MPAPSALMPADPDIAGRRPQRSHGRDWSSPYFLIGVLAPLAVLVWLASNRLLSFDGAMNMQVAQSLAEGGSYSRPYGDGEPFPHEIQTSSYFLGISAAILRLFGTSALTLQAANLVFSALLLVAVARAVRPSKIATLLVPGTLLFVSPGLLTYSLGGYGEGAVAALFLVAFLLIANSLHRADGTPVRIAWAFAAIGTAVSIKTVALAVLPAALLGLLAVVVYAPRARRIRILTAPLAIGIPLVLFELYRLLALGSHYIPYWQDQFRRISGQVSGESGPDRSVLAKAADHFHLLAEQSGAPAELWVVLLVLVPAALGLTLVTVWRTMTTPEARRLLLALQLTLFAEYYFIWWLAITPTEKAWLRRITIGIFALFLAGFLVAQIAAAARRRRQPRTPLLHVSTAAALACVLLAGVIAWPGPFTGRLVTSEEQREGLAELAAVMSELDDQGAEFYGVGWWSAPVVGLHAEVHLADLAATDLCAPPHTAVIERGDAYVVWDFYARSLSNTPIPSWAGVELTATDVDNAYGALWQISLEPDTCPAR